ncbi:HU domain-containing protein [Schleiferia thermophila]|uniref:Sporulation related protein n=1 Tax=Schleiferia thermophila TaxID=884107 RepID=A0A369A2J0_9FLAO|nr:SPOR domain-containing protein [Schleiferia thermophila]RCX02277.1 sporulation related protein [Schleiferia thermophila]GCD80838.1 hypothetical protein JCM30197_20850 [Schleiferia thermophila]
MTINQHIIQLLYSYDCVIIPGFGGFVSKYFPAEIQEGTYMFRPPSKRISFNARLKENDGLLAHYISRKEGVSYQEAMQMIEISVRSWQRIIESGNKVTLEGIGKLYSDAEGNLQFSPALEANFLTSSYGLGMFRSPAITEESIVAQTIRKQAQIEGSVAESRNATVLLTNFYSAMKVAAVLLVVFTVVYIAYENSHYLSKNSTDSFSYIGFVPAHDSLNQGPPDPGEIKSEFEQDIDRKVLEKSSKSDSTSDSELQPEIPGAADEFKTNTLHTQKTEPSNVMEATHPTGEKMHTLLKKVKISAGIFGHIQNAQRRQSELSSHQFSAVIEPAGSMHRVVIYCTKEESDSVLAKVRETVVSDAFVVR